MLANRLTNLAAPVAAKIIAALSIACIVLTLLLIASGVIHYWQFQRASKVTTALASQLAASEARGAAQMAECAATNERVAGTVHVLGNELHACRGDNQKIEEQRALVMRERDRARREAAGQAQMRAEVIRRLYETNTDCRAWGDAPVCRGRSEQLLGDSPAR